MVRRCLIRFVLRAACSTCCVTLLVALLPTGAPSRAADAPFPDLQSTWFAYRDSIEYLRARHAIGGYPDGTFRPKEAVNRAELLKMIFTARGTTEPAVGRGRCFRDVSPARWYASYVCAAARRKIVSGYPDHTFKPERPVTVVEAVKMVALAYGKEIAERPGEHWYEPYARELDKDGVFPRHTYLPSTVLTRERAADLIARVVKHQEDRVLPNLSAGCGKSPLSAPPTLTVNGRERSFLLTQPRSYTASTPYPLVVVFHGRTNDNAQVRSYIGFDRALPDAFIAYPAALPRDTGGFSWSDPGDKAGTLRDLAFFDAIVSDLAQRYCIDLNRIFTAGHSLGAWFANSVACARGDVVRASGTVGGDSMNAPCAGPVAAFMAHNPHDNLASFSSTEKAYEYRAAQNECGPETDPVEPQSLLCRARRSCDGGNEVIWCPHEIDTDNHGNFYPHIWPDGAAEGIAAFFQRLK